MVAAFGALAAFAGIEHGVGEIRQGWRAPPSLVFESWPDTAAFEVLSGEPALTVIPNLVLSGALAIIAALAVGVWSVGFTRRLHAGLVLVGLSIVLLLVGGGFGPPLIGIIAGLVTIRAAREPTEPGPVASALAPLWPWVLGVSVAAFLALVPGVAVLNLLTAFEVPSAAVVALIVLAFSSLLLAFVAAIAHDSAAGNVMSAQPR